MKIKLVPVNDDNREAILALKKENPDMQAFFLREHAAEDAGDAAESSVWYPEEK